MSKETFIDGNKTLIDTDYYLHLLQIENNWNKLKEWLKKEIERNTPNVRWKHYNEDGFND